MRVCTLSASLLQRPLPLLAPFARPFSTPPSGGGFFDRLLGKAAGDAASAAPAPAPALAASTALVAAPAPAAAEYTIEELRAPGGGRAAPRAQAVVKFVPGHCKKLDPVARQVRGLSVNEAMAQMAFSSAERARALTTALRRAAQRAELYHALPTERLMVEAAWTGRHTSSPRIRRKNRGRSGRSHKRTSQVFLRVREMSEEEATEKNRFTPASLPTAASRAKLSPRGY